VNLKFENYIDEHGAITQHPKWGADEGDSAFFCGHLELLRMLYPPYYHQVIPPVNPLLFFPDKDGMLVRHAKAKKPWIREKDRGSRDQYTPWICVFAVKSQGRLRPVLKDIAKVVAKRFGFFTNTRKNGVLKTPKKLPDNITPEVLSILLRGLLGKWGKPLYYMFDMWLIIDVLYTRYLKNDTDIANHLAILLTSNYVHQTFLGKLALRLTDLKQTKQRLRDYFTYMPSKEVPSHQVGRNPFFLAECYILAIKEYTRSAK